MYSGDGPKKKGLARLINRRGAVTRLKVAQSEFPDFAVFENHLRELAARYGAIHLVDAEHWFDDLRWQEFNIRREAVAMSVRTRLMHWLPAQQISRMATLAPDLWAWRSGVFDFAIADAGGGAGVNLPVQRPRYVDPVDNRSIAIRSRRVAELRQILEQPTLPDDFRGPLLDELAQLQFQMGHIDEALRIRTEDELPVYTRLGDVKAVAITQSQIEALTKALRERSTPQ